MGVKALVFGADKGLLQTLGHAFDRDEDTGFGPEFTDQLSVAGVHAAHNSGLIL